MITLRPAAERGVSQTSWLDSRHTFSFNTYFDPKHVEFRALRVINEDRVAGGGGFGTHGHRDMEIISYVLSGGLGHKDSTGTGSVIRPGDAQRMSAGRGIMHSEKNASATEPVHFLQIWITPADYGIAPGYEQKSFPREEKLGKFRLIASNDGRDGTVTIHQDVDLYVTELEPQDSTTFTLRPGRHAWIQVTRGAITVNGTALKAGDGAAVSDETTLAVTASEASEVLLFDLA
ncbi:MAG: pirin family protein [Bryobacteraceae bacterium]